VLIGIGAGVSFMPLTVAALTDVAPERAGTASGLLQMAQQIGGALGLAVLVTVYASQNVPGQVVTGMSASYLMATGFLVVALVLAATLLGRRRTTVAQVADREQLDLAA
jgi:MFS family permease